MIFPCAGQMRLSGSPSIGGVEYREMGAEKPPEEGTAATLMTLMQQAVWGFGGRIFRNTPNLPPVINEKQSKNFIFFTLLFGAG